MCSSRIPLDQPAPMFVEVKWRRRRDEQEVSGQPEEAPVTLQFRSLTQPAHGSIRFDARNGPEQKGFNGDTRQLLTIFGQSATAGAAPDIALEVRIDGELRDTIQMSVGDPAPVVNVRAENGTADAPAFVLAEEHTRLKAVVEPATQGTFRWLTFTPSALEVVGNAQADTVEVVAHRAQGSPPPEDLKLYALFTAQGENPVSVMTTHTMSVAADLEQLFTEHVIHTGHLTDINFRRRLEALRPPEVQLFLDHASAPPLVDYLTRLLAFVNEQEPLRAAPEGDRPSITFIMGAGDDFYNAANAHFTRVPSGTFVTNLRNLRDVRDHLLANRQSNGRRWGEVNIVVHANEEGGMSIPVRPLAQNEDPAVHEVNLNNLRAAIANDEFPSLPDDLIDVRTTIRIRGCAIGRSQEMLTQLSQAFGGNDAQRPIVRAPKHLQAYSFTGAAANPTDSDEFYVEFWFIGFPQGHPPGRPQQIAQFNAENPGAGVDWAGALSREGHPNGELPTHVARTRTYTFEFAQSYFRDPANDAALATLLQQMGNPAFDGAQNVQITSRTNNPDGSKNLFFDFTNSGGERITGSHFQVGPPPPTTDAQRMAVLRQNQSAMDDLARINHTVDDYTWSFPAVTPDGPHPGGGGRRLWTLAGTANRTIIRVERELREPDPARAGRTRRMHPALTDLTHFGEEVPVREPAHPLGENVAPPEPATP